MLADYILRSRAIFDALTEKPFDGYVAIKGNRIIDVGSGSLMEQWKGPQTKVLDYGKKLIMPGICESHAHNFFGVLELNSVNVEKAKSEEEAAKMVYDYNREKSGGWIFGFGWNQHYWERKELPTRKSLDSYFPDTPVLIFDGELHSVWVNSKALELCNITAETPDPPGGKITRDQDNQPTGHLLEPAAMKLALDYAFKNGLENEKEAFREYFNQTAALGITAISDMQIFDIVKHEIYLELEKENDLKCRVHLVASAKDDISSLNELRDTCSSDKVLFSGVKEFIDGTAMAYTGLLIEPYCDVPGYRGHPLLDVDQFREKAIELDRNGFRIRLHACGDGAVRLSLDILEEARRKNGPRDSRHSIEHIENIHPDDLPRFKENEVIASVQPEHLGGESYETHPFHRILGEDRINLIWPFRSLFNHGAKLAFGSDHPVVGLNPMDGIYRAVTRLMDDKTPEGGWLPDEKMTLEESLKAYTIDSAYQMFREKDFGSLEAGKLADITVLDRNIFETDFEEILETKPAMTMMDGKIVFEA